MAVRIVVKKTCSARVWSEEWSAQTPDFEDQVDRAGWAEGAIGVVRLLLDAGHQKVPSPA